MKTKIFSLADELGEYLGRLIKETPNDPRIPHLQSARESLVRAANELMSAHAIYDMKTLAKKNPTDIIMDTTPTKPGDLVYKCVTLTKGGKLTHARKGHIPRTVLRLNRDGTILTSHPYTQRNETLQSWIKERTK